MLAFTIVRYIPSIPSFFKATAGHKKLYRLWAGQVPTFSSRPLIFVPRDKKCPRKCPRLGVIPYLKCVRVWGQQTENWVLHWQKKNWRI
jgi:hypothetical protein